MKLVAERLNCFLVYCIRSVRHIFHTLKACMGQMGLVIGCGGRGGNSRRDATGFIHFQLNYWPINVVVVVVVVLGCPV
jgi:UDP-N-acetylmuramyl tripeptide synthase